MTAERPPPDPEDLRDLEDAALRRLLAKLERALGATALALGPLAAGGMYVSGVTSVHAYGVAAGVAVLGALMLLFGDTVVDRLRRRRRKP